MWQARDGALWRSLLEEGTRTLRRFPLPMACAAGFVYLGLVQIHDIWWIDNSLLTHWMASLLLGLFASLAAGLFAEHRRWPRAGEHILAVLALGAVSAIVFFADPGPGGSGGDEADVIRLAMLGAALVALVSVAPFLGRRGLDDAFWEFNRAAWLGAAFGLLCALVLGAGLSAVFFGIETLFGLTVPGELYGDIWLIAHGLAWPWITLAMAPEALADGPPEGGPRWIRFLASTLLVPLVSAYMAILYAYSLLILFTWDLPRGNVASVVCGFAAVGAIAHLVAYRWRETGNPWLRLYCRHFPALLVVPIVLLGVAVGARIGEYGITEARYLLILVLAWLVLIAAGFLTRRAGLTWVPLSLAILLLLGSHGPQGAFAVSMRSQTAILIDLLQANGMLADGQAAVATAPVGRHDRARIEAVLDYLIDSEKQAALEALFASLNVDFDDGKSVDTSDVLAAIGLQRTAAIGLGEAGAGGEARSFHYSLYQPWPLDVAGWQVVDRVSFWSTITRQLAAPGSQREFRIAFFSNTGEMRIASADAEITLDLAALAAGLNAAEAPQEPGRQALILEGQDGRLRARVVIESLSGEMMDGDVTRISGEALFLLGYGDATPAE